MQLWIEFGLIGAIAGSVFLKGLLYEIHKLEPLLARICLAGLMATLAVASTGYGLWQGWWLGAFVMMPAYSVIFMKIILLEAK